MKKIGDGIKKTEARIKENPIYYKIDHRLAVDVWESLYVAGYRYISNSLSESMIEQGCQEIETNDTSKVLAFWRDYLEKHKIIKIGYK
tara:strand:- start:566 stop:829 length:264 start_codon:yes stop_codon:yes gene_type:complete